MVKVIKTVPALRFPEFNNAWKVKPLSYYFKRHSVPVDVQREQSYQELGVRSHAKGIFHKDPVTGESLGNKRVFWVHPKAFVVNIVFGWEQAIAMTSEKETGFIASHRFPMFLPKDDRCDLDFMLLFFKRKKGKYLLGLASPGGAGRNKTLGQNDFLNLDTVIPETAEQIKITAFYRNLENKLVKLECKKKLLESYKYGLMQMLFSNETQFKQLGMTKNMIWKQQSLDKVADIVMGSSPTSTAYNELGNGLPLLQGNADIKFRRSLPRIYTSDITKVCNVGDILLSVRAPVGHVAISDHHACIGRGICAIRVKQGNDQNYVHQYLLWFEKRWEHLSQGSTFDSVNATEIKTLPIPVPDINEQKKIAETLAVFDSKIAAIVQQIQKLERFKQGLLQQMFV